ncbi:mucin-like protein [Aquarana catesbeiana]|uniref:mucin-like protein n=1 Tax=Aquarana catesbeiana TaxID=8400 RepID=UPI003CC98AF5
MPLAGLKKIQGEGSKSTGINLLESTKASTSATPTTTTTTTTTTATQNPTTKTTGNKPTTAYQLETTEAITSLSSATTTMATQGLSTNTTDRCVSLQTLMTVPQAHVKIMVPVLMDTILSPVFVQLVGREAHAMKMLMNAPWELQNVTPMLYALTPEVLTHVPARQDIEKQAKVVNMWMNVLKGSIFVTSMQCAPTHLDPTIVPVTVAIGEMALPVLFTDNGVIVFQRNIYDRTYALSYPYTTFKSNDPYTPPILAAFWADVDVSGFGDIFYQVYNFQSTNVNTTFKESLESTVAAYFNLTQFKALWALKITWDNVPPFKSGIYNSNAYWNTQVNNTNTFQVVLVTDGIYSFALILFDDGGMKWIFNALPTFHLPKMGYHSGIPSARNVNNFPAFNDPQTDTSVSIKQRYRPDQYIGYNTGKKGRWAYRLDSNSQSAINSRLQCLQWYYKEEIPYWISSTSPCPCTYNQATSDSSFTDGFNILNYGFDIKKASEQYLTVQNMFPSRNGAGSRCYYSSWSGALVYGEKERYLPTPWTSFNTFKYYSNQIAYNNYFWNTVLPPQRQLYKVEEIDSYNTCCRYSESTYLCNLYRQKRPLDYCDNYIPPRLGFFYGDPHINTLDGLRYTFNGLGEFILTNAKDENDTVVFRLQGRTARAGNGTSYATNFVALAASTSYGDQIQWSLKNANETTVSYNGTFIELSDNLTYVDHVGFGRTKTGEAKVLFDNGISVSCSANLGILSFVVTLQSTYQNRTEGLLGVLNGNPNDDFLTAYGSTLPYNDNTKPNDSQIFNFGMTWKTTPEDTIFLYNTTMEETWYTYNNNSFVPMFLDELLSSSDPAFLQKANSTCGGNTDCLYDILSTGNFAIGSATMISNSVYSERRSQIAIFPPNISGPVTIMSSLGEQVLISFSAADSVFSLETESSDLIISVNGTLTWLPSSSTPVFATVIANNSQAIAEQGLTLILCNCSNNATCDYENTLLRGQRNNSKFMTTGCNCSSGWTGEFCTEDLNACLENSCFNTSSCIDNPAPNDSYTCSPCPDGLSGDGIKCYGVDECFANISKCEQICIDTWDGYNCSCNTGYRIDPADTYRCDDIDECMNKSICAENAVCTNTPGSYNCQCASGYNGDPHIYCTDKNECATPSLNNCSSNSLCINTNGSYYCECLPGYTGSNCTDIDKCRIGLSACEQICINTPEGFNCSCNAGYRINQQNPYRCDDIDECAITSLNNCTSNSLCINTNGSYSCECLPGYSGPNCTDVLQTTMTQTSAKYISEATSVSLSSESTGRSTSHVNPTASSSALTNEITSNKTVESSTAPAVGTTALYLNTTMIVASTTDSATEDVHSTQGSDSSTTFSSNDSVTPASSTNDENSTLHLNTTSGPTVGPTVTVSVYPSASEYKTTIDILSTEPPSTPSIITSEPTISPSHSTEDHGSSAVFSTPEPRTGPIPIAEFTISIQIANSYVD